MPKIDGELNILLKMRVTYSSPYVFLIQPFINWIYYYSLLFLYKKLLFNDHVVEFILR